MSMKLLEGERALITGCAGGIGRGIAKALLAEGAAVLGSDITAPPAGDDIDFLAADLSTRDGWKNLLDGATKKLGTISLFVHAASAGLVGKGGVGEPITQNPSAISQRRPDHLREMLSARGEQQQRLGLCRHALAEDNFTQRLAECGSTGLAREGQRNPARAEYLGDCIDVRALSGAVDSLEGDEPPALRCCIVHRLPL